MRQIEYYDADLIKAVLPPIDATDSDDITGLTELHTIINAGSFLGVQSLSASVSVIDNVERTTETKTLKLDPAGQAKGTLIVADTLGTTFIPRVPGADDEMLVADSSETTGLAYRYVPMSQFAYFKHAGTGVVTFNSGQTTIPMVLDFDNGTGITVNASGELVIAIAGRYKIELNATITLTAGTGVTGSSVSFGRTGLSFATIPDANSYTSHELTTRGKQTHTIITSAQFNAGNLLFPRASAQGTDTLESYVPGTQLTVTRLS